ncbi:MAG TPA: hypothetical protein VMU29_11770 [Smithella sp.]|nr:hypothetical protein [Smithella sp.]
MDRMTRLVEVIENLIESEITGYIRINFTQGSLGRIEKFEEIEDAASIVRERKKNKKEEDKNVNHESK